ncbi:hypothetical protein M9458_050937 [Cirrhinus mrigala]|uniref:DUF4371 domain-containing protein n=1 Tax=Cirrhinus mrigala TaxID=683832 RepID=A0ABD0MXV6_CIRMR
MWLVRVVEVTAAELTQVYHTIKHNISFISADCGHKLNQKILHDSKIVKKMSVGRTKAEAMAKDVLAPKAVADVVDVLKSDKPLPFSIQIDASNKGNRKMFPLAVQYFRPEMGICNKMLDFGENADESAAGIIGFIEQSLDKFGLSLSQVTAYSADNTNVNYGIHNSVFTNLKKKQKDLLQGNCHAHIVHNTVKHALDQLTVDVENVVLKVYGHFSTSAKRRESLKDFCQFCDVEFHEILRHVSTRWLSLNPAISRLLQTWTALRSYFISLGEECPRQIRSLLKLSEASTEEDPDDVEVYLLFCNNILSLFEEVVKKLESDSTTCVEIYSIMSTFKQKLTQRRDDQFYGYLTKVKLQNILPHEADRARADFTAFFNTAISYIEKCDTERITSKLNLIQNVNMDDLYDECTTSNTILKRLKDNAEDEWKSKDVAASINWLCGKNLLTNKWSDSRNRSELLITLNFKQACSEFYSSCLKDKQLLLQEVHLQKKVDLTCSSTAHL